MPLKYKIIKIYTSEDVHWRGKLLYNVIIEYVRGLKLAARCVIQRGIAGCYENGEISTQNILDISFNLPLTIEIILPAADFESVMPKLEEIVVDGIITTADLEVRSYHSSKRLIPQTLRVKEVMTPNPKTVSPVMPVNEVIDQMLKSSLKGVPVVNSNGQPIGIITQKDLMAKAKMPVRLSLFEKLSRDKADAYLKSINSKVAKEIMSQPLVTLKEEQTLREAVQTMIGRQLKRLPVVNSEGILVGALSRIDVLQTIAKQAPEWRKLEEQSIIINNTQPVKSVLQRELLTVQPDAPIGAVIEKINSNENQRIAVVDQEGKFLGLISDADLLPILIGHPGLWELLLSKLTFTEKGRQMNEILQHSQAKTAAEVMLKNVITIREETTIDEAVRLITKKGLKRLPVVDERGIFKGLISRDSILQAAMK